MMNLHAIIVSVTSTEHQGAQWMLIINIVYNPNFNHSSPTLEIRCLQTLEKQHEEFDDKFKRINSKVLLNRRNGLPYY